MGDLKTLQKQYGIGITGGAGTGKSTVCDIVKKYGYLVVDADQLSRKAVASGSDGLKQIVGHFGASALNENGDLDRPAMRQKIFSDPTAKVELERITHPIIRDLLLNELGQYGLLAQPKLWFYEASLLFETGQYNRFRQIWLTHCSAETQIMRLIARDNIDCDLAKKMVESQSISLEEKRLKADVLVDTDIPQPDLEHAIKLRLDKFPGNY
ncbi:MAG: dephospho-CoA kinase [Oligoflexales bacterium]